MKPTNTRNILLDTDYLDETVLEVEEEVDGESIALEASIGTEEITVWEELPDAASHRALKMSGESEETITEQLVSFGNEEADLEQREAAAEMG